MRISTNTIYQAGISKISQLQVEQSKLQEQIATGRRIQNPSDDPVASARGLVLRQAQGANEQFASNRGIAIDQMSTMEGMLGQITELMVATKANLVAAGNAAYSDQERGYMADEVRNTLEQLVGFANSRDAEGNYLFSGFQTKTQPYTQTATGATYNGDAGQRMVQVESDRQIAVNVSGPALFTGSGSDIFTTLTDLVTLLNTPITDAASRAAYNTGLTTLSDNMQAEIDNILSVRADIGSKLKELDTLDAAGADRGLQYSKNLSELEDLDYAQAISQLSQQKIILEAAQQSFVKTTGLSLFTYM